MPRRSCQRLSRSEAKRDLEAAEKFSSDGNKLRAYQRYAIAAEMYSGYPAGDKASAARCDLGKDPALRKEVTAMKQLEKQRELARSSKPAVCEKARTAIQKIIDDQPDSEAARQGREYLHKK